MHSTGIAAKEPKQDVEIRKLAIDPINFLDLSSVKSMINTRAVALIGHNRHATQGAVNNNNAHPFTHGDITLAHNGTLTNKWQLERDFNAPKFDTDSELVCWLIDNYELDAVIPELKGAFALTWWDDRDQSMNIIRNDERPLHVASKGCNVYWASEKHMLAWLLDRNNIADETVTIFQPKVGMHICMKYANNKMEMETKQLTVAKKTTPRGTQKAGQTTGATATTSPNNVVALPPKSKQDYFKEFGKHYGFTPEENSTIFVYVDEVKDGAYAQNLERVDVLATLSCDPYSDVKIYFAEKNFPYDAATTVALKLKVRNLKKVGNNWEFTASNKTSDIEVITKDDLHLIKEMDKWEYDNTPPFITPDKEELEEVLAQDCAGDFRGYDNKVIPYLRFEAIINKGCCVCSEVLDPVEQALDRTCHFVSDDDVICQDCAGDEQILRYYGFQVEEKA